MEISTTRSHFKPETRPVGAVTVTFFTDARAQLKREEVLQLADLACMIRATDIDSILGRRDEFMSLE